MRIRSYTLWFAPLVALALALAACGTTTTIEQSWRSPTARRGELTNVVTVALTRDAVTRRNAEDKLAAQLQARGMRAVPSYTVLSNQDLGNSNRAVASLQQQGFDGAVAMRFVSAHQQLEYYPSFYGYWGAGWGNVIPETIVRVEINAYSLPGDQLLWSAMSRSVDPGDLNDLVTDVSKVAAASLQRQQLIATQAAQR